MTPDQLRQSIQDRIDHLERDIGDIESDLEEKRLKLAGAEGEMKVFLLMVPLTRAVAVAEASDTGRKSVKRPVMKILREAGMEGGCTAQLLHERTSIALPSINRSLRTAVLAGEVVEHSGGLFAAKPQS